MSKDSDSSAIKQQFDERLRLFYTHLAAGRFDLALNSADNHEDWDTADKIVLAALSLRQDLQKLLG